MHLTYSPKGASCALCCIHSSATEGDMTATPVDILDTYRWTLPLDVSQRHSRRRAEETKVDSDRLPTRTAARQAPVLYKPKPSAGRYGYVRDRERPRRRSRRYHAGLTA